MNTSLEEEELATVIVSEEKSTRNIIVLKKYYPRLDTYLREKFKDVLGVELKKLASGRHNMNGLNHIEETLKGSGPPDQYQGYKVEYPVELSSKVSDVLSAFSAE